MLDIALMFVISLLVAVILVAFTLFTGIKYIHPGSHRGYADTAESKNLSWKDNFTHKWWDFRDIPLRVNDPLAHIFRLWWWMATGVSLKTWASIHRHNHLNAEEFWKHGKEESRWKRAKMYFAQRKIKNITEEYSIETPNTFIDKLYYAVPLLGPVILLAILYYLLGMWLIIPILPLAFFAMMFRSESVNGYILEDFEWNRLFNSLKSQGFYK